MVLMTGDGMEVISRLKDETAPEIFTITLSCGTILLDLLRLSPLDFQDGMHLQMQIRQENQDLLTP